MLQPLQKTICWLNILVLFDPAKALWSIYPKNLKTYPHRNLHVNNYSWNQLRCLSVREWSTLRQLNIKVQKRNELSMHKKTWRNLKRILLSAKSQLKCLPTVGHIRTYTSHTYIVMCAHTCVHAAPHHVVTIPFRETHVY